MSNYSYLSRTGYAVMARPLKSTQLQTTHLESARLLHGPKLRQVTDMLSALADPTRLNIISALVETEHNVGELARLLNRSESAISHQLRILRENMLVGARQEGRNVYYSLADQHIANT